MLGIFSIIIKKFKVVILRIPEYELEFDITYTIRMINNSYYVFKNESDLCVGNSIEELKTILFDDIETESLHNQTWGIKQGKKWATDLIHEANEFLDDNELHREERFLAGIIK